MSNTPLHIPSLLARNKWTDYRQGIFGDSFNWSWNRPPTDVKYVVIHHTAGNANASPDNVANIHKNRGWGGIGYHFVITSDGMVYYVGDVGTARANVKNQNEKVIGICLTGDFTKHLPTDVQIESAHDLCKFLIFEAKVWDNLIIAGWDSLKGHKDFQATSCPGTSWPNDMRQRIIDRRIYSPVIPEVPPETPIPPTPEVNYKVEYNRVLKLYNKLQEDYSLDKIAWEKSLSECVDIESYSLIELLSLAVSKLLKNKKEQK